MSFEEMLPEHKGELIIAHNEQTVNYHSVEQEIEDRGLEDSEFVGEGDPKQRCIDTDELWTMQWYPYTPIGFYIRAAPTLVELLENWHVPGED